MKDYKRLDLCVVTEPRGCGYHYLVQKDCSAYTAFRTLKALRRWMNDRGLTAKYSHRFNRGHAILTLHGKFEERMIGDLEAWGNIRSDAASVPFLSNGEYTLAKVTQEGDTHVLTYLGPNASRPVLPYRETSDALDRGEDGFKPVCMPVVPRAGASNIVRAMAARDMLLRLVANFPGLYDGESPVDGADLVEWVGNEIHAMKPDPDLESRARFGTPVEAEEGE